MNPDEVGRWAAACAFALYDSHEDWRDAPVETGFVLWKNGDLPETGACVEGEDETRVSVYSEADVERIRATPAVFFGDLHTHTKTMDRWCEQLPSPFDLVPSDASVFCDFWPVGAGHDEANALPIAPRVQLVQSLLFGDCFMLTAPPGRVRFAGYREQKSAALDAYYLCVAWHENAERHWGDVAASPEHEREARWTEVLAREVPLLIACLGQRVDVTVIHRPR